MFKVDKSTCKAFMNFKLSFVLLLMVSNTLFAQNTVRLTGTVFDYKKGSIPGASVQIGNSGIGTVTNIDGRFTLDIPTGKQLIEITYVKRSPIRVSIDVEANKIYELVATLARRKKKTSYKLRGTNCGDSGTTAPTASSKSSNRKNKKKSVDHKKDKSNRGQQRQKTTSRVRSQQAKTNKTILGTMIGLGLLYKMGSAYHDYIQEHNASMPSSSSSSNSSSSSSNSSSGDFEILDKSYLADVEVERGSGSLGDEEFVSVRIYSDNDECNNEPYYSSVKDQRDMHKVFRDPLEDNDTGLSYVKFPVIVTVRYFKCDLFQSSEKVTATIKLLRPGYYTIHVND